MKKDSNSINYDPKKRFYSQEDKRLNRLLQSVIDEVNLYSKYQLNNISRLTKVGLALSAEKNIDKLLEMIVDAARELTNADAGTLYIVDNDNDNDCLKFEVLQNETMKTRMGGTSGNSVTFPPVALNVDNKPNYSNVSSFTALTGKIINIPDVYEAEGFDFTGPRKYDEATGYRSKSMLVIPMKNHENDIIGVLQLLNAKDIDDGEVVSFSRESEEIIGSLASQAAVALTNTQLIQNLKELFYAFIKSIAAAIDEKSPYTGGHINRVVTLTMMMAEKIDELEEGPFAKIHFSEDEFEELRLATWMHDVGKIVTPEYVIDKSNKLETIFDRIELIESRFDLIAETMKNHSHKKKIDILKKDGFKNELLVEIDQLLETDLKKLKEEKDFIVCCNCPDEFMNDDKLANLKEIADKTYTINNIQRPYISDNELYNLSLRKGSLTPEERKIIENHANVTATMLNELPFPKKISRAPEFASGHHEKIDGSGYPLGLKGDDLPIQSRIMAIADIFEALTAKDRPYKSPMKLSQAIKILEFMKNDNHIDSDIYDLFVNTKLYKEYAESELKPEQIDD